jgi:DNA-binding HxlR family transcriptional regulator
MSMAPDLLFCRLDQPFHIVMREVAENNTGASALRDDGISDQLRLNPVAPVIDDDRLLARESLGNGFADPLAAAGDERLPAVQLQIHRRNPNVGCFWWRRLTAMAGKTSTHLIVPIAVEKRAVCLGPEGSVAHVTRVVRMIRGRWKLPILFRLFADPAMRTSELRRDLPGISQKMLTQHLRELERDGLIERIDFGEKPLRVEYQLSEAGKDLRPVLIATRNFSVDHPV